jgi:hypothetical protein
VSVPQASWQAWHQQVLTTRPSSFISLATESNMLTRWEDRLSGLKQAALLCAPTPGLTSVSGRWQAASNL